VRGLSRWPTTTRSGKSCILYNIFVRFGRLRAEILHLLQHFPENQAIRAIFVVQNATFRAVQPVAGSKCCRKYNIFRVANRGRLTAAPRTALRLRTAPAPQPPPPANPQALPQPPPHPKRALGGSGPRALLLRQRLNMAMGRGALLGGVLPQKEGDIAGQSLRPPLRALCLPLPFVPIQAKGGQQRLTGDSPSHRTTHRPRQQPTTRPRPRSNAPTPQRAKEKRAPLSPRRVPSFIHFRPHRIRRLLLRIHPLG
jgi:hypothetical protein